MENAETLGQYLKSVREERKIPLAQIAQELKIKLELVQAIENNEFNKFPASTYVKGFLRSYAKYLNLDPETILAAYNKQYPQKKDQDLVLKAKNIPRINLKIEKIKIVLLALGIIILIAVLSYGTLKIIKYFSKPHEPQKTEVQRPKTPEPTKQKTLSTPFKTPFTLIGKTKGNVWLRVHSDKQLIFEGILTKGEEKQWEAEKELKLKIGNPGELSLTLNGQELEKLAPYGGPINVTIDEKGIKVKD